VHGEKARRRYLKAGKEWWGKRPLANNSVYRDKGMKFWKKLLHKIERRKNKKDCNTNEE
jgi:hypothetical protein